MEKKTFQITKQNSVDIQKALIAAERSIKKDINNWIVRFAKNNEVSIVEARKMLNNDELKEFKWDVKEFIKYGEENALNQEYMKELENASARFHISRLEAIELSIRNEFEKAYKIQDDKISQNVLETYDDRYYRTCYEVQSKFGIGFDVSGVDTDKVKKLISKPWASDNKTFSDRVWTKKNEMIDTLRSQLIRTCATGGNIQDAVNSMMSFVSKDVKNARYAATRLMQTETAFFSSVSEKKALKDLDVEQYEILATLDSKTSPICQEMDGQVFKLSEYEIGATAPPFHVNCRSTTCPHFDDEYGERIARDRAGNTYMVPGGTNFESYNLGIKMHAKCMKYEQGITKDLQNISDKINGELVGLEYRIKSMYSLLQKINKILPNIENKDNIYNQINDALRYTCIFDISDFTKKTLNFIDYLNKKGYNKIKVKNTFNTQNTDYKGINCIFQYKDGYRFELQFHTRESYDVKQNINHKYYEEFRKHNITNEEKNGLMKVMISNSNSIRIPKNIELIQ